MQLRRLDGKDSGSQDGGNNGSQTEVILSKEKKNGGIGDGSHDIVGVVKKVGFLSQKD